MQILRKFPSDQRGNSMQMVAITAAAVALASLAGAHLLDKSVQTGALQQVAGLKGVPAKDFQRVMAGIPSSGEARESLRQVTLDYTPTGSIPANLAAPIVLDPCTGIGK